MGVLQLVCADCGSRFASGVPFLREHLAGVKLRALEVCPSCGRAAEYAAEDYLEPLEASVRAHGSPREDTVGVPREEVDGSPRGEVGAPGEQAHRSPRAEADGPRTDEAAGPPLASPHERDPAGRLDAASGNRG